MLTHRPPVLLLPGFVLTALMLSACGESAKLKVDTSYGAEPALPEPVKTLIPTVKVAPAMR